jgi:hypothetical protein
MPGELHELSLMIGGLRAEVNILSETVQRDRADTIAEHREVHNIVSATCEAVRNLTHTLDEIKPVVRDYEVKRGPLSEAITLTEDYREHRAERRGIARLAQAINAFAGGAAALAFEHALKLLAR